MRVFITGAGLLGCHAARALRAQGDHVTFFDLVPQEAYVRQVAGEGCDIVRGDIRELPLLLEAIRDVQPDVVLHTAGLIGGVAQRQPYRGLQVNIGGTLNVVEAVRLLGVRRLLHSSTLGVHDLSQPQTAPLKETFPVGSANTVYRASKVACEQIVAVYAKTYGFECAMLRYGATYGYGHYAGGSGVGIALSQALRSALAGQIVELGSRMAQPDEYVYVKDVAAGIALAVHAQALPHSVYNLGSGQVHDVGQVRRALQRVLPEAEVRIPEGAGPTERSRKQPMDLTQSRNDLGYEPRFDLESGLADFLEELKMRQADAAR